MLAEEVWWLPADEHTAYRKHEGIWYVVKFNRVFASWRGQPGKIYDIFYKKDVSLNYGWNTVVIAKKQCNRDELKKVRYLLQERSWRIRNI